MAGRLRGVVKRFWQRGLRLKSEWEKRDMRWDGDENEEKSWCLERENPPGWPAILISVGSFALPRRSNRSKAVFNHSIADAPDPSSCHDGDARYPGCGRIRRALWLFAYHFDDWTSRKTNGRLIRSILPWKQRSLVINE